MEEVEWRNWNGGLEWNGGVEITLGIENVDGG